MAQKTFEEILSESTELKLTNKFKDKIFEFSNDVNAMGIVVNTREDGNSKFFFKDQEYTKPITDNELLAMYLDEVVPTRLVDNNKSLERIRDLKSEKLKFLEYKSDDITKKFYKIGNYFSGETYNSFHDGSEDEKPVAQTIWEGTFDAAYSEDVGGNYYTTQDIQNGELIKNCNEVTVTFDGTTYTLPVEQTPFGYGVGDDTEPSSDHPFILAFMVESPSLAVLKTLAIFTLTEGEHTIKVEGAPSRDEPSGDTMRVLYDGTPSVGEAHDNVMVYNMSLTDLLSLKSYSKATLTIDGVSHIADVVEVENPQATSWPPYYVLGVNYPPTEFDYEVGVMLTCALSKTGSATYSAYIVEPIRERMTEHHVKVEVDENDARRVPGGELNL